MDGKWETVVDKKKQHRKQEQAKQSSGGAGASSQSAFASLDAWERPGTAVIMRLRSGILVACGAIRVRHI